MMTKNSIISLIRLRPILLGSLVACAFLITLGLCGLAISILTERDVASLTTTMHAFVGIGLVIAVVMAFAIASLITCASVVLETRRSALLHSLGSWAFLSLLLGLPALLIIIGLGINFNVTPLIVTDVNVLKSNAITTITLNHPEDKKRAMAANAASHLIAWTMCLSLALGCGTSIAVAHMVYAKAGRSRT